MRSLAGMTSYNFQAKNRLKYTSDVEVTFRKGKYLKCGAFSAKLYCVPAEKPSVKFLVSIPKKRIPKAVDRNTMKRRTREAFRYELPALNALAHEHSLRIYLAVVFQHKSTVSQAIVKENITSLSAQIIAQIQSNKDHETNS